MAGRPKKIESETTGIEIPNEVKETTTTVDVGIKEEVKQQMVQVKKEDLENLLKELVQKCYSDPKNPKWLASSVDEFTFKKSLKNNEKNSGKTDPERAYWGLTLGECFTLLNNNFEVRTGRRFAWAMCTSHAFKKIPNVRVSMNTSKTDIVCKSGAEWAIDFAELPKGLLQANGRVDLSGNGLGSLSEME